MNAAIFAGICALLGTIIGQLLSKQTQHKSWLLQKRAEIFAKFLSDLTEFREVEMKDEQQDPTIKASAIEKAYTSANIVCLFLPENTRAIFREHFETYMKFEPVLDGVLNVKNVKTIFNGMLEAENAIQQIFQRTLKENRPL